MSTHSRADQYHPGDFVRRPDDKAMGTVDRTWQNLFVIVKWPSGLYSKHRPKELIHIA